MSNKQAGYINSASHREAESWGRKVVAYLTAFVLITVIAFAVLVAAITGGAR